MEEKFNAHAILDEAASLYRNCNYTAAIDKMETALQDEGIHSEKSNFISIVADCYINGRGVEKNYQKAISWLEKGITANCSHCIKELAEIYKNGRGVKPDTGKAIEIYMRASSEGDGEAAFILGGIYSRKDSELTNIPLALEHYKTAIYSGYNKAYKNLGDIYYFGRDVERSAFKASQYYLELNWGVFLPFYLTGWAYHEGVSVQQDFSRARYFYLLALEDINEDSGNAWAKFQINYQLQKLNEKEFCFSGIDLAIELFDLGTMHHEGSPALYGIPVNYEQAKYWYLEAINAGSNEAQYNLALMYAKGQGGDVNYIEAKNLLMPLVDYGDSDVISLLEDCEIKVDISKKDYESAAIRLTKSAKSQNAGSQYQLAIMYLKGLGLDRDNIKGLYWMKQSAITFHPAQFFLADMYEHGKVVSQDIDKAIELYQSAAEDGNEQAIERLRI